MYICVRLDSSSRASSMCIPWYMAGPSYEYVYKCVYMCTYVYMLIPPSGAGIPWYMAGPSYVHTSILHVYICVYMCTCAYMCVYVCILTPPPHPPVLVSLGAWPGMSYVYVYMCTCVYMYTYMCVYVCILIPPPVLVSNSTWPGLPMYIYVCIHVHVYMCASCAGIPWYMALLLQMLALCLVLMQGVSASGLLCVCVSECVCMLSQIWKLSNIPTPGLYRCKVDCSNK